MALVAHPPETGFKYAGVSGRLHEKARQGKDNTRIQQAPLETVASTNSQQPSSEHKLQRALSRVTSLEKTIEYLQTDHKRTLEGLYQEIARLQDICSDVAFEEVESNSSMLFKNGKVVEDVNDADEVSTGTEPYYVLLNQQKRKYQSFIERISTDNKRKQQEIEALRAELDLVRDVLAIAGLNLDLGELRNLVQKKNNAGVMARDMENISRSRQLPPMITSEEPQPQLEAAVGAKEPIIGPAPPNSTSGAANPPAKRQKHYRNPNLDYQGRAQYYRAVPPELLAPAAQPPALPNPTQPTVNTELERLALQTVEPPGANDLEPGFLPPLPNIKATNPVILKKNGSEPTDTHLPELEATVSLTKTNPWTKKIKGAKLVRQKMWKEMNQRI